MRATLAISPAPVTCDALVGIEQPVPLLDGRFVPYVNLDNAASTPAFRSVVRAVDEFLPFYSGVHRGTGYKSRLSTATFERARELVGDFLGADPERDVVVFTKNTTEAINKLVRALAVETNAVVLTTMLEHHSNDLPWRSRLRTVHVGVGPDGTLDVDDLDRRLVEHAGRIALFAVSGASNVTGVVQPVHQLAEKVHAAGGRILVDAAQLAAHRPIDMRAYDDPGHLDFVVLSAHKMYAPYGTGALVGPRCAFAPTPDHAGGGTVNAVTTDTVAWADLPDREEAGSPNVLGAVALAAATRALTEIGLDHIAAHESELAGYAADRLAELPGLRIHGPTGTSDPAAKVGVIPFTIDGIDHSVISAVLGYEHGVGVRSGCFCAHPYIAHLLNLDHAARMAWVDQMRHGDKRGAPGMVRISFGCYNDRRDVDLTVAALEQIIAGEIAGDYRADDDGSYRPAGYIEPALYSLDAPMPVRSTGAVGRPALRRFTPRSEPASLANRFGWSGGRDVSASSAGSPRQEAPVTAQSNRATEPRVVTGKELYAAAVNEGQARAAAGITMALGAVAFVYANFDKLFWPIRTVSAFFCIDFLVRVTAGLERSPSGIVAGWMTRRHVPQWVSAKPKRFAWTLGLAMAIAMTVITNSGIHGPLPRTICLICLTLMWMEAVLGLCLGCEIYGVMVRRGWRAPDAAFEICANGACDLDGLDARRPDTGVRASNALEPDITKTAK